MLGILNRIRNLYFIPVAPMAAVEVKTETVGPHQTAPDMQVQSVGAVYNAGNQIQSAKPPQSIDLTLDNLDPAPKTFIMFDSFDFVKSNMPAAYINPTGGSSSVQSINKMSGAQPLLLKGFNYEVSNPAQFSNSLKVARGNADGSVDITTIPIRPAKRNTQYNANLLTFECNMYIDGTSALILEVNGNTTVYLTLFVESQWNVN